MVDHTNDNPQPNQAGTEGPTNWLSDLQCPSVAKIHLRPSAVNLCSSAFPQDREMIGRDFRALPVHQSNKIARHDPISLVAGLTSDGFQSNLIKLPNVKPPPPIKFHTRKTR